MVLFSIDPSLQTPNLFAIGRQRLGDFAFMMARISLRVSAWLLIFHSCMHYPEVGLEAPLEQVVLRRSDKGACLKDNAAE